LVAELTDRDLKSVTAWIWRPQELRFCQRLLNPKRWCRRKRLGLPRETKRESNHQNNNWQLLGSYSRNYEGVTLVVGLMMSWLRPCTVDSSENSKLWIVKYVKGGGLDGTRGRILTFAWSRGAHIRAPSRHGDKSLYSGVLCLRSPSMEVFSHHHYGA
jgi:hypothetical protein